MAKCEITGKKTTTGRKLSINRSQVSKRAKRQVKPNIQKRKVVMPDGTVKKMNISTSALRTMNKRNNAE